MSDEDRLDWLENNQPREPRDYRLAALLEAIAGALVAGVVLWLLMGGF